MSSIVVKGAKETKSLVWFRNDLRVNDNLALNSALSAPGKVIGFYCFNLSMFKMTNLGFPRIDKFRAKFLLETIENLKEDLKRITQRKFAKMFPSGTSAILGALLAWNIKNKKSLQLS